VHARGPQLLGQIYGNHASPNDAAALLSVVSPEERTIAAAAQLPHRVISTERLTAHCARRELINRVRLSARRVRTPSRRIDLIYGKRRIGLLPSNYRPVLVAFEYFRKPIAATMMTDDRALNQRLTTSRYRVTARQRDVLCKSRGNRGHEPAITSLLRGLIRGD